MVFTASLLGARHVGKVVENKPASLLVVSLVKALNWTPPPLCGRQVAHTFRKWQLPSECGCIVQNMATHFAFSRKDNKYGRKRVPEGTMAAKVPKNKEIFGEEEMEGEKESVLLSVEEKQIEGAETLRNESQKELFNEMLAPG